tara:strand:+ start:5916 stop:6623 length:708 start_codon:yes stop_codon:yes gene_type:complete
MQHAPQDVTVIIPVINEAANLQDCIASVERAGAGAIIVVDGGSTDRSVALARSLGVEVILSSPGRGIQQNAGAERAQTPLLCFLHADCRLTESSLKSLCLEASRTECLFACFRQQIDSVGLKYRLLEWGNALRVRFLGRPYGDQGICLSTKLFREIGGFANVALMEDVLLAQKLKQQLIRPRLLSERIIVNARRWQRNGVIRQTLKNWSLLRQLRRGKTTKELAEQYRRDDQQRT